MAVAWDATSSLDHTGTTNPDTWSHTGRAEGSGGIQGVIVAAINYTDDVREVSAVTYGGVPLTLIGEAADAAGEATNVSLWLAGSGLTGKGGTQTVSVTFTTAADDHFLVAYTFTAANKIAVVDWDVTSGDQANPTVALSNPSAFSVLPVSAFAGGLATTASYTGNHTVTTTSTWQDSGQEVQNASYGTTTSTATTINIGYTSASDDTALIGAILTDQAQSASAEVASAVTKVPSGSLTEPVYTRKPTTSTATFNGVESDGGSTYVAVGGGGAVMYSTNGGVTWTSTTKGTQSLYGVAYGNGYWVAVGAANTAYYFTDPAGTWTTFDPFGGTNTANNYSVGYGNGWWAISTIVGGAGLGYINGNPTGTWTYAANLFGGTHVLQYNIRYDGTYFYGSSGWYRSGNPGGTWTQVASPPVTYRVSAPHGGYYLGAGVTGQAFYATSPAGTWTAITAPAEWRTTNNTSNPIWDASTSRWLLYQSNSTDIQWIAATDPTATWTFLGTDLYPQVSLTASAIQAHDGAAYALGVGGGYLLTSLNVSPLSKTVGAAAGVASATGTAYQPTISAVGGGSDTNVDAGEITDTALAQGVTGKVDASAGVAAAAGAGQAATGNVSPTAGLPAPAGAALTGTTHIKPGSNAATSAGGGLTTTSQVDVASTSNSASAAAYDATTTSQAGDTNAQAGVAAGAATAEQPGGGDRVSYAGWCDVRGVRAA